MISQGLKKSLLLLPSQPGVYIFLKTNSLPTSPLSRKGVAKSPLDKGGMGDFGGQILYIGKATNLKDRVKSYLPAGRQVSSKALFESRGPAIVKMVEESNKIDFIQTDTVLEALILEANLIKKHQPKYNTKEKDNKSFNYVCITGDALPKVLVIRGRNLFSSPLTRGRLGGGTYKKVFGPFPNGSQLRDALKILRRFFPFFDNNSNKKQNQKFYEQLGLTPKINPSQPSLIKEGVVKNPHDKGGIGGLSQYKNNIKNLILFFEGKKTTILKNLEKQMLDYAKKKEFEKADEIKKKIFALNHINDVALIKEDYSLSPSGSSPLTRGRPGGGIRIEAYDIAHLSGSNMVGAFVVVEDGELNPKEYRTFNIKGFTTSNDAGALGEVISRRFNHHEWKFPDLIIADGNQIQKNVIEKELKNKGIKIPVIAVVKDSHHKARALIGDETLIKKYKKQILLANAEVHRFVLAKHKIKRSKNFLS